MEGVFPPDCKEVADELDGLLMFIRTHALTIFIPNVLSVLMLYHAASNATTEWEEAWDLYARVMAHDFYAIGFEIADVMLTLVDGAPVKTDEEAIAEEEDID